MDESYLLAYLLPVPLWGCAVSVAAPRGDKSGVVSVFRMKEYTVVTIPCFEDGFLLPLRDRSCLVERRLGVVSFSGGINVERLEVDCPSGCAILLAQMTFRWHHMTGSPIGMGSSTPSFTTPSRPALTSSCQWRGIGMGE